MKLISLLGMVTLAFPAAGLAGTMTFSGNFTLDEDVVLIPFSIGLTNTVTIQTTSFADGTTGFEPVLTVYDFAGNLLFQDAMGGTAPGSCGGRTIDPASGFCLDALIQNVLNAGAYTLALTEWDNIPGGPTLADGFPQTGNGNFTGTEFGGGQGSFLLFDGSQRNNNWALQITAPDLVTPEPATLSVAGASLLALIAVARKSSFRRTRVSRNNSN